MALVMTWRVGRFDARTAPRMARLSASVPPLVKNDFLHDSFAGTPSKSATRRRANSRRSFAACPK